MVMEGGTRRCGWRWTRVPSWATAANAAIIKDRSVGTDDRSETSYAEVAHCNARQDVIQGTVVRCITCFDVNLCEGCYPEEGDGGGALWGKAQVCGGARVALWGWGGFVWKGGVWYGVELCAT